jgi:hypothetical protein
LPANHKVSVAWQIVFTFIPILNLWAFYRIRKLRKYLLFVVVPSIIVSVLLLAYIQSQKRFTPWGDDGLAFGSPDTTWWASITGNVIGLALQGLSIYLVIIWSKKHNENYSTASGQV